MAKRKQERDSEDDLTSGGSASEQEKTKAKAKAGKVKSKAKEKASKRKVPSEAESDSSEEEKLTLKKPRLENLKRKEKIPGDADSVTIKKSPDGDKYIDLGKKRRATVRSFKGMVLLDIREFYGSDGDEKPGKKGISLQLEQWEALKNSANTIDGLFAELKK